jgi:F-type H+-transporting ATPase subunit b
MRRIRLLLAAAIICIGVFGIASPAHAEYQPTTDAGKTAQSQGAEEDVVKCVDKAQTDTKVTVESCIEAPNPLLPETNELIYGVIGFVVVFFFLWRLGYPSIKSGMNARADRIRNDLDSADQAKAQAQQVLDEYRAQLADAKGESNRIIEEARNQAEALKRDQEQRLQAELTEMRQRATAEVEAAKVAAIADLRSEVTDLAINAAEVVVGHNLDRATQLQLVENYINQVGSRS